MPGQVKTRASGQPLACFSALHSIAGIHNKRAYIDREIAAKPELVQIENGWRNPEEQSP